MTGVSAGESSDEEEVVVLDLRGRGLRALPAVPVSLLALRCGGNRLASLPAGISELEDLQALDCACNDLMSLPAVLPRKLEMLAAAENDIVSLPERLPETLSHLGLAHNRLACLSLGDATRLTSLALGGNKLRALPASIGRLSRLRSLAVYDNDLECLPESLGDLGALVTLKAGGNRLAALPRGLGRCAALTTLAVSGNRIADASPLSPLVALRKLWFGTNRLVAFEVDLPRLELLDLERNGDLARLVVPPTVEELRLYGAAAVARPLRLPRRATSLSLGGLGLAAFPSEGLGDRLVTLRLEHNNIAALPAAGWNAAVALELLWLNANDLAELPEGLCDLPSLAVLGVASNRLAALPERLATLATLRQLRVERNDLVALPKRLPSGLVEVRCYGNRRLRLPRWPTCRTLWVEKRGGARRDKPPARRVREGRSDDGLPYANFLVQDGHAHCVVAFGAMDMEWGGTLHRAGLRVDVCHLYDDRQTSYAWRPEALRAFLAALAKSYAKLSFLGSSRGAYGACRYADLATGLVFALSPLRADVRWRRDDEDADDFPRERSGAIDATLLLHVGRRNHRDVAVAERIKRHIPNATIVLVPSAGHGPDLYRPAATLDSVVRTALLSVSDTPPPPPP